MTIYSIAKLIKNHGLRVEGRRCGTCGEELLYAISGYKGTPESFLACLKCDVTFEELEANGLV